MTANKNDGLVTGCIIPAVALVRGTVALLCWLVDSWQMKHSSFPQGNDQKAVAYQEVLEYFVSNKKSEVGEAHYSDPPFWSSPCNGSGTPVRVVAPVIDPANGNSTDVTMLFCDHIGFVSPANQQAAFYVPASK